MRTHYLFLCISVPLLASLNAAAKTTVTYIHSDILGSVIAKSNVYGRITERTDYEAYGEQTNGQKAGIGYTGHLEAPELGLTYMQQRYYDPSIGRFYSNDPVGFNTANLMTFNRYAYANNNPYKYVDPDGRESSSSHHEDRYTAKSFTSRNINSDGSVTVSRETLQVMPNGGMSSKNTGTITNLPQRSLRGAPATPTAKMENKLLNLSNKIQKNINVHSGSRSQEQQNQLKDSSNNIVASSSQHTVGDAADISAANMDGNALASSAASSGEFERVNLYPSGAVHVDQKDVGAGTQYYENWKRK